MSVYSALTNQRREQMTSLTLNAIKWAIVFSPIVLSLYAIGGFARLSLIGA
jgi:hypothetical protein